MISRRSLLFAAHNDNRSKPHIFEYDHPNHPVARGLITADEVDRLAVEILNRDFSCPPNPKSC